jgi:hypothetical protein
MRRPWRARPGDLVQWAQSAGWNYHGIGRVHVMGPNGQTLCKHRPKWGLAWSPTDEEANPFAMCENCQRQAS